MLKKKKSSNTVRGHELCCAYNYWKRFEVQFSIAMSSPEYRTVNLNQTDLTNILWPSLTTAEVHKHCALSSRLLHLTQRHAYTRSSALLNQTKWWRLRFLRGLKYTRRNRERGSWGELKRWLRLKVGAKPTLQVLVCKMQLIKAAQNCCPHIMANHLV